MRRLSTIAALLALTASSVAAQSPRIGAIDFYGRRSISENALRSALGLKVGDTIAVSSDSLASRLMRVRGVGDARVAAVCCENGRTTIYVGILEGPPVAQRASAAPTGDVRLPESILEADRAVMEAIMEGVQKGDSGEDDSRGYTLYNYPRARAAQKAYLSYAPSHSNLIRDVLKNSGDAQHRALAALLLPYAGPTQRTVNDLAAAMNDGNSAVRNNAMRGLGVLTAYAHEHPEAGIKVPASGFAQMLNSIVWTDRNKAAFALMQLTETRDANLLGELARNSLDPLLDMARWKAAGHAMPALMILGRIAGLKDETTFQMMQTDRQAIITAALAKLGATGR